MKLVNTTLLTPANMLAIGSMLVFLIVLIWAAASFTSNS